MAAQDYEQVTYGAAPGAQVGSSATEKVAFHGATPVAQRAGAAQAALTLTTATVGGTGFTSATGFTNLLAQVEEIRAALVEKGLIKGAA